MTNSISLLQKQKLAPTLKQTQKLMLTREMQQAIYFLQLPLMELSVEIEKEMEQNPILEWDEGDGVVEVAEKEPNPEQEITIDDRQFEVLRQLDEEYRDFFDESGAFTPKRSSEEDKKRSFLENSVEDLPTLSSHLMNQAREVFSTKEELKAAEILIGYLDDAGFLKTPLDEISSSFDLPVTLLEKVIAVMQTFEPIGVFSQNIQQLLLIQLRLQGKEGTLPYRLVHDHFEDLLHSRLVAIQRKIKIPIQDIQKAVRDEISHLDLHPGAGFSKREAQAIVPDVKLRLEGEKLIVEVKDGELKPLRFNRQYLKMLDDKDLSEESKEFIKSKLLSAKWLVKNIEQRGNTLFRLAECLAIKHRQFFVDPEGSIRPLIMKQVADDLGLHESTIARAVANKYLESPRGIFPLRYFFSGTFVDNAGEDVSATTVKDILAELIDKENPKNPLSDAALSKALAERGIPCARRTVAKYRGILELGSAKQRRRY